MPSLKPSELSMRQLRDLVNDRPLDFEPLLHDGLPCRVPAFAAPVTDPADRSVECPRYAVPLTGMGG